MRAFTSSEGARAQAFHSLLITHPSWPDSFISEYFSAEVWGSVYGVVPYPVIV